MRNLLILLLLVLSIHSSPDFLGGLSRESASFSSSVPSATSSTLSTIPGDAGTIEARIDLDEAGKRLFEDFFASCRDILYLAQKLNSLELPGSEDERQFYLQNLKESSRTLRQKLSGEGEMPFLAAGEKETVLEILKSLAEGESDPLTRTPHLLALEKILLQSRDRLCLSSPLSFEGRPSFNMEKDETIRLVLMDLQAKSCRLSGSSDCPSWSDKEPGSTKDLKASFHILKSLFGGPDLAGSDSSFRELDFRFEKLANTTNHAASWQSFSDTAMGILDRYSQSPSIFYWMRKELKPPDSQGKWKDRVLALLQDEVPKPSIVFHAASARSKWSFIPASFARTAKQNKDESSRLVNGGIKTEGAPAKADDSGSIVQTRKKFKDGSLFVGEVKNGLPHGKGMLVLPSGSRYTGQFEKGYPEGEGVMEYHTGSVYKGEFHKGERHGKGTFFGLDGSLYRGTFDHNQAHGQGSWILSDGTRHDGLFKDGVPHGNGVFADTEGNSLEGEFSEGNIEGEVFFEAADKSGFLGTVNSDLEPQGEAWFFSPEGDAEANWQELEKESSQQGFDQSEADTSTSTSVREFDWRPFGQWGEQCRYRGEFKEDYRKNPKPQGFGVLSCSGMTVNGSFVDGRIEGYAVADYKEGSLYQRTSGEYRSNHVNGLGEILYSDGRLYTGDWFLDKPAKQGDGLNHARSGIGRWLTEESSEACRNECYIGTVVNRLRNGAGVEIYGPKNTDNNRIRKYEGGFMADLDSNSWVRYGFCQVLFRDGGTYSGTVFPSSAGRYGSGVLKDKDGKLIHKGKVDYSFRPVKDDKDASEPDWAVKITEVAGALSDGFVSIIKELTLLDTLDIALNIIPLGKVTKPYAIATAVYGLKAHYEELQKSGLTEEAKAKIHAKIQDTLIMIIAGKTLEKIGSGLMKVLKQRLKRAGESRIIKQRMVKTDTKGTLASQTPNAIGAAGENAVNSVFNIGKKQQIRINGRTRIPDGITENALSEVKNVKKLSLTKQLKDYMDFAQNNQLKFDLYVRPSTRLSKPLLEEILAGRINLKFIPGAN